MGETAKLMWEKPEVNFSSMSIQNKLDESQLFLQGFMSLIQTQICHQRKS